MKVKLRVIRVAGAELFPLSISPPVRGFRPGHIGSFLSSEEISDLARAIEGMEGLVEVEGEWNEDEAHWGEAHLLIPLSQLTQEGGWEGAKLQGSAHYKTGSTEPIDLIRSLGALPSFALGNIIKYASRLARRPSGEDLEKIRHYAELLEAHWREEGEL